MALEVIYVTRHGFRSNWNVNSSTGVYTAHIPSPTGIPSDPALSGYGVQQSHQLASHLITLDPPIERFYSSPFYRCLQTLNPTLEALHSLKSSPTSSENTRPQQLKILGDNGLGEWYGTARFDHPSPATPDVLKKLWPRYDAEYQPTIIPSVNGETIPQLHNRTAYALTRIIEQCDQDGVKAIIICTHAATIYAVGRSLTGNMPEDVGEADFNTFTCGLSKFVRRKGTTPSQVEHWNGVGEKIPFINWKNGIGVGGGWDCVLNGDCQFLEGGEERGWAFSGDESFLADYKDGSQQQLDAGVGLGKAVEGRKNSVKDTPSKATVGSPSRL